jgi:hypothetical protein
MRLGYFFGALGALPGGHFLCPVIAQRFLNVPAKSGQIELKQEQMFTENNGFFLGKSGRRERI